MINVPLLRKTLEYIEHNPEDWDQRHWGHRYDETLPAFQKRHSMVPCATACCFAGNAVLLAGGEFTHVRGFIVRLGGWVYKVDEAAQQLLGLTEDQAAELFHSTNTVDDLRRVVDRFITQAEAEAT